MNNNFVHLKLHSEYSILDSIIKIDNIISKSIEFNMHSIALTDFNNIFGAIKFYEKCCINKIKPIIGIDFLLLDKDINYINKITLLVKNLKGYYNLIKLISELNNNKKNNNNQFISKDLLFKYNNNLILIINYKNDYIFNSFIKKKNDLIENYIISYKKKFNEDLYFEINKLDNSIKNKYKIDIYVYIAKKYELGLVATNDIRFINKEDYKYHEIRVSIYNNISTNNKNKNNNIYNEEQYFKSSEDMKILFNDIPESITNAIEISKKCNLILDFKKKKLPNIFHKKFNSNELLIKLSKKGLITILKNKKIKNIIDKKNIYKKYYDRINEELKIIISKKFSEYFLIVHEFVQWANSQKILVGPGRGSGAGSLVSYCLNITNIDPIEYNLLFERFLNYQRVSMPDLDIDFCMEKRDLVINHIIEKYGKDNVFQIITFNCLTPRSVIKEVGRVMGYTYTFIDKISKLIPFIPKIKIQDSIEKNNELKNYYQYDNNIKKMLDICMKLEGIVKNVGKHSGGVIISKNNINTILPLYYNDIKKGYLTCFDKNDIEKIGLIKFDFLGLKTLTIIDSTINKINNKYFIDKKNKFDINKIPLDDTNSFELLSKCKTNFIFQLESKGIKDLINKIKPKKISDIIDIIALYRPGPLNSGMVNNYIDRKNKIEKIYYLEEKFEHIILKEILYETYGIILYQEQIIKIAQLFSNYSLYDADIFRSTIGKKNEKELKKQKNKFILGAIKKNNISYKFSENVFNIIEKFANYGFNKSHSTAYGIITYQTLWLKANYKLEYMSSVINYNLKNNKKIIKNIIIECKSLNIKIYNFNINISNYYFDIYNNGIICGLGYIEGLNKNIIDYIIKIRNKNIKFNSLLDMFIKLKENTSINKRIYSIIINNGCCDIFGYSKKNMLELINKYLFKYRKKNQNIIYNQLEFFD